MPYDFEEHWHEVILPLPEVERPIVFILRQLGAEGRPELDAIPEDEREALFFSLSTNVVRAEYHRQRFHQLWKSARARWSTYSGRVYADSVAKFIAFESAAALSAYRGVVDEVLYIGGRRNRHAQTNVDQWTTRNALSATHAAYAMPEAALFRGAASEWLEELTEYRNALVHRGTKIVVLGYFPSGVIIGRGFRSREQRDARSRLSVNSATEPPPPVEVRGRCATRKHRSEACRWL